MSALQIAADSRSQFFVTCTYVTLYLKPTSSENIFFAFLVNRKHNLLALKIIVKLKLLGLTSLKLQFFKYTVQYTVCLIICLSLVFFLAWVPKQLCFTLGYLAGWFSCDYVPLYLTKNRYAGFLCTGSHICNDVLNSQ